MKKLIPAIGLLYMMPMLALAQFDGGNLQIYIESIISLINRALIPAILAIAFLVFIWGIFQYFIAGASDEEKRESGRKLMLWGIIGFVVIIAIVGIVNLLAGATGLGGDPLENVPEVPSTF